LLGVLLSQHASRCGRTIATRNWRNVGRKESHFCRFEQSSLSLKYQKKKKKALLSTKITHPNSFFIQ
jgi:hypothetical protein